ncbi:MAG TPA: hypothetical protein VGY56_11700 [Verrucomicrobiae bacterium]|nr:hypothetical protein [Verrucomicrobiae bacterium]
MKSTEEHAGPVDPSGRGRLVPAFESLAESQNEITGLPGLPRWSHVYFFVFACFVLWVSLLLILTVLYS